MKNRNGELLLTLASAFLLGGSVISLASCGNNEAPTSSVSSSKYSISINAESIVLDTYASFQLVVKTDYEGVVAYESTNPNIASVDENGLVASYGEDGECIIKVKVGEETRSLKTTVSDVGNMPVLVIEESEVPLLKDDVFYVSPSLLYKGVDVTSSSEIIYTSSDSSIASVSSVLDQDKSGVITGLNVGEAVINIKATVYGKTVVKEIAVKVSERGSVFIVEEGFDIDINTLDENNENTTIQLHAGVFTNGAKVDGATITYESLNADIATITSDGLVTAVKTGNCRIKLSSSTANGVISSIVNVHVGLSVRTISNILDMEINRDYNNIYVGEALNGTVESISWDGQNVAASFNATNKYITIDGNKSSMNASESKSESELKIYTSTCRYDAIVNPYSMIIKTPDDFEKIRYRRTDGWADITKCVNITGYYILGNDIDFASHVISQPGNNSFNEKYGFIATFDGRGHTMKNTTFGGQQNCLFGSIGTGGVVKNTNFDNVIINDSSYCALIGVHCFGTVKDVTINLGKTMEYRYTDIGIIASRSVSKSYLNNITINAAGYRIANVFGNNGYNVASSKNIVINAKEVASLYYEEKDTAPHASAEGVKINLVD